MKMGMKVAVVALVAMAALIQGCKTGGGGRKTAKDIAELLGSDGSGTWSIAKTDSRIKNFAVYLGPDGKYYAFNTSVFDKNMTKDEFLAAATVYSNLAKSTDSYQKYETISQYDYTSSYCPYAWSDQTINCSPSSVDSFGNVISYRVSEINYGWVTYKESIFIDAASGLVFEMGDTTSKDLESVSAAIEAASNDSVRDMLVSGYGLSESRASEIASLAKSWQNIEKSRAMTAKDLVQFQSKVFGSDLSSVKKAAEKAAKGDKKDYDALVKRAAQLNDVSPEQAKAIFNDFLN
ncbi:hypothetical protein AZI86_15975 [Bdellovibrio bacteriovorus]|uniref:Lipoprotein n=1 Tax=Bdellovibrio bacteriovorus TaxID=959 RepID=A0A150WHU8_BDEBC|nr:hypothetical protein [Bdellovibrio bacteriovorus]KYG63200.1 hypothetical protein AZI86_15975 [Bdellovibrio bacteriovorus]